MTRSSIWSQPGPSPTSAIAVDEKAERLPPRHSPRRMTPAREEIMTTRWLLRAALAMVAVLAGLGAVPHTRADQVPAAPPDTPERVAVPPIRLVPAVSGLTSPLFAANARDSSGRLFIVEQPGRIRILAGGKLVPKPFLDLTGR